MTDLPMCPGCGEEVMHSQVSDRLYSHTLHCIACGVHTTGDTTLLAATENWGDLYPILYRYREGTIEGVTISSKVSGLALLTSRVSMLVQLALGAIAEIEDTSFYNNVSADTIYRLKMDFSRIELEGEDDLND